MRISATILAALAIAFTSNTVLAMNSACEECSSTNAKASSAQCNTTLANLDKDLTADDISCLKSLVANTNWIQSCIQPNSCTAEDITLMTGTYNMVIQAFESGALSDNSSGSSSNGSGNKPSSNSGSSGSTSTTETSKNGAAGLVSSDKLIALGAVVAMAVASTL
ncbi:hypothetical protein FBU30_008916 [Linnemannia zychae]|nr:hypothetical protein FBU30_008916 [Linnemannia zychae]